MENKNTILVPWDFTRVAESALFHAVRVSKIVNNEITLLHITKKTSHNAEALEKMEKYVNEFKDKSGIKPNIIAREGNIFTTINEVCDEIDANLVIMGTHGIRGMQKLTGSWALKVIVGSKVPFVVVQDDPLTEDTQEHFREIVFPVDFRKENKEKINSVLYLAKYYNSKVHLIVPNTTNDVLKKKIANNVVFAKKMFGEREIEFSITNAEGANFADETIMFAQKLQADLILIMTTKDIGFADYVMGAAEQSIIANTAKIPVMCVNPRKDLRKLGGFDG